MKKYNLALKNSRVFLLRIKYANEKIKYPMNIHSGTLGIFTNLKYAEHFLKIKEKQRYNFLEDRPFKIYEIEEIILNYFWNFIRTRFYDHNGQFYGEHKWEEESKNFDWRFKKGDLVGFVDGSVLRAGIVAGVPPDTTSPFKDYYLVLYGCRKYRCFRAAAFNVFPLSAEIPDRYGKRLLERFKKEHTHIKKLKQEEQDKSDNTTYRIIE